MPIGVKTRELYRHANWENGKPHGRVSSTAHALFHHSRAAMYFRYICILIIYVPFHTRMLLCLTFKAHL